MIVHEKMSINLSTSVQEKKNFTEEISSKIEAFQKKEGIWITSNCQHILHGNAHYYGIHKDQQIQLKSNSKETILATREIYYIIVYGDDESCKENGTLFGDDVTTSDFFSDSLLMLDGGAQSFRQACNALLLDQNINILSGLRSSSRAISIEIIDGTAVETPFFGAAKFLRDVTNITSKHGEAITEDVLQNWYKNYFGMGKCYVGNPSKGDFDTKQKLMDDAWDLFISEKLYLKIEKLVTHK